MVQDLPLGVDCMIESGCLPLPECFDLTVDREVLGELLVPQPAKQSAPTTRNLLNLTIFPLNHLDMI